VVSVEQTNLGLVGKRYATLDHCKIHGLSDIVWCNGGPFQDGFPWFLRCFSKGDLDRYQGIRTSDRRDLDKGLSLSPGAMLYARRRPPLDFESLIFKTAMDLRLAGEIFGEDTMLEEPRWGDQEEPKARARSGGAFRFQTERDL